VFRKDMCDDITFTFALIRVTSAEGRLFQARPRYARMKYRKKPTSEKSGRFACRAATDKARQLRRAERATFQQFNGTQAALSARNIS
jgi:hypothetical protein